MSAVFVNGTLHKIASLEAVLNLKEDKISDFLDNNTLTIPLIADIIYTSHNEQVLSPSIRTRLISELSIRGMTLEILIENKIFEHLFQMHILIDQKFEGMHKWGITNEMLMNYIVRNKVVSLQIMPRLTDILLQSITDIENEDVKFFVKGLLLQRGPWILNTLRQYFDLNTICNIVENFIEDQLKINTLSILFEWGLTIEDFRTNNYNLFIIVCKAGNIDGLRFLFDKGLTIIQEENIFASHLDEFPDNVKNLLCDQGIDLFYRSDDVPMGAHTSLIQSLPSRVPKDQCPENAVCGICRDFFLLQSESPDQVLAVELALLPCNHMFHKKCLEDSIRKCGICIKNYKNDDVKIINIFDKTSIPDARRILVETKSYSLNLHL